MESHDEVKKMFSDTMSNKVVALERKQSKQDGLKMISRVFEKLADEKEGENDEVVFNMTFYKIRQLVEVLVDFVEIFEDIGDNMEFLFRIIKKIL